MKSSKATVSIFIILQPAVAVDMFPNFKVINDPWTKTFQAKLMVWY